MKDEIKEILFQLEIVARKHTVELCEDGSKIETMPASVVDELRLNNYSSKLLLDYITNLQDKIKQYEDPEDLTLFYMWLDEKAKDKMKQLQEENERLKDLCDKYEEEHNTAFKLWKGKLKETIDETLIQKQHDRIKELEQINEEHHRINGELRKTINEAIEYIKGKSEEVELNFYGFPDKITSFRGSVSVLLNILQNGEENE